MSTPEQSSTPPLTRRQLREIRTGATPIVSAPESPTSVDDIDEDTFLVHTDGSSEPAETPAPPITSAARPAAAAVVSPAPGPDAAVDLDASPLTRRQARQQERLRTASVPVLTPDFAARYAAEHTLVEADDALAAVNAEELVGADAEELAVADDHDLEVDPDVESDESSHVAAAQMSADDDVVVLVATADEDADIPADGPVVNAEFGAELLVGEPVRVQLPPTFDQLITRDTSSAGSVATPNALILSQTPSTGPLTGPITATGEVLLTGSFDLPEGLGSTGHASGTADGREVDAVLIDGELPAHSSPTPIAASAAISTVRTDGEIIRPPAPEKGNRLMLVLAITAGALMLAVVTALVIVLVTGVVS